MFLFVLCVLPVLLLFQILPMVLSSHLLLKMSTLFLPLSLAAANAEAFSRWELSCFDGRLCQGR